MIHFGICTQAQYARAKLKQGGRRFDVSFSLLDIGDDPTPEDICMFEEINCRLRTSNGTYRMTSSGRLRDVDAETMRILTRLFPRDREVYIEDRAVSDGMTSCEWAEDVFKEFPRAEFEASDALLHLFRVHLSNGGAYIAEPNGRPLQYIKPPFVLGLCYRPSLRYPLNIAMVVYAKWQFERLSLPKGWMSGSRIREYPIDKIPCVHPRTRLLNKVNGRFHIREKSVFEHGRGGGVDVLRTMNILNKAYFSVPQLVAGAETAFDSLKPGGIWIVGRTLEQSSRNAVTFLRKQRDGWQILSRIGGGSEMEEFAARHRGICF